MVKKRATAASSEQGIQDLSATGKEKTTKTTESRKYLIKQKKSNCSPAETVQFFFMVILKEERIKLKLIFTLLNYWKLSDVDLQIRLQVCPSKVGLSLLQVETRFKLSKQVCQSLEMFPRFRIL